MTPISRRPCPRTVSRLFETYTGLREVVGAMPAQVTTAFFDADDGQGDPRMIACGGGIFLARSVCKRCAMRPSAGFGALREGRKCWDAALLSETLILIRNWVQNGEALDALD